MVRLSHQFFFRYKEDGSPRPIIYLKNLNSHIVYSHFKMETLKHALDLISEECWLASLDIKDAYFHVKIDKKFWKYLKFSWKGTLYCFSCLCLRLASAPRIFAKLCKPIVAILRGEGHIIIIFLDDILVIRRTFEICQATLWETFRLCKAGVCYQFKEICPIALLDFRISGLCSKHNSFDGHITLGQNRKVPGLCKFYFKQKPL